MKKLLALLAAGLMVTAAFAQTREVHIVAVNDVHANIKAFPQFAAIVDSLRAAYPGLLVVSAGDNRTGDPLNDMYEIPAYPMVALMNQVGFDATTLGNHEVDSGPENLARLIGLSGFSYICCNVFPDPELNMHLRPTQVFDVNGIKVGFVGVLEIGPNGLPDSHPDNCKGLAFAPVLESVRQYASLRESCDVVVLLSHIGYDADVEISARLPWVDLIIGGHSHTQIEGGELHNGILVTQDVNKLQRCTHITLTLEDGRLVDKKAELIEVSTFPRKNRIVQEMVDFFSNNPAFQRVLCEIKRPLTTSHELGCMMADAFRVETGADIAFINAGGVRFDAFPAGPFTVNDGLSLDPFGNDCVELTLSGAELKDMLIACTHADHYGFPDVSGIQCTVYLPEGDNMHPQRVDIFTPDGKKLDPKKLYKVVTNSYVVAVSDSKHKDPGHSINRKSADLVMDYMEKQGEIDYAGVVRVTEIYR